MNVIHTPLLQDYAATAATLPGAGDARITALRANGATNYRSVGLPHPKIEAWKYTRLKDLEALPFSRAGGLGSAPDTVAGAGLAEVAARIVLVDGRFVPELSVLPIAAGVSVASLRSCLEAGEDVVVQTLDRDVDFAQAPLAALASAYLEDGAVLKVADGVSVALPIEVVAMSTANPATPTIAFPRLVVSLGEGAELTLVESFSGPALGVYAVDAVTDIAMGKGAKLKHYVLQHEGRDATHVSTGRCDLPEAATYEGFILQLGGKVARHEMRLRMIGEGSEARLNGAYAAKGDAICDTTTQVDHIAAETTTDQVFKGILDGKSKGIYQGKVHVFRDAQRIVGNQMHNALLLSRAAEVDCKPELEIYADDVKCSHGATCGELSEEQVFYLQSRGVDVVTARAMLLQAFLGETFEMISEASVSQAFAAKANAWLDERERA
jgi:Fe-S cluster assembly protein SufD